MNIKIPTKEEYRQSVIEAALNFVRAIDNEALERRRAVCPPDTWQPASTTMAYALAIQIAVTDRMQAELDLFNTARSFSGL